MFAEEVNNLERIPVQSSNLKSVGYDERSQTLEVEFLNGGIYQYTRLPKYVYEELMRTTVIMVA